MPTSYTMLLVPRFRAFDLAGDPLTGGKVYVYEAGTTTLKASYTTSALSSANTNPVILDANGQADIWVAGPYKVVVTDSAGVQQYTQDNLYGFGGQYISMPTQDVDKVLAWGDVDGEVTNSTLTLAAIEAAVNVFNTITMLNGGVVAAAAGDTSAGVLDDKLQAGPGILKTVTTDGAGIKTVQISALSPLLAAVFS